MGRSVSPYGGDLPRDISCDHGKGAQCLEPTLRWLLVGRGRPGSAAAVSTASQMTDVATCCLHMGTLVSVGSFLLGWAIPAQEGGEVGVACSCDSPAPDALSPHLDVLGICPRGFYGIPGRDRGVGLGLGEDKISGP